MRVGPAIAAATLIAICASARAAEELVTLPVRDGVTEIREKLAGGDIALSPHGYFGREEPTAQAIRNYMLGRDFTREIGVQQ